MFAKLPKSSLAICIKGLKISCQQNTSKKSQICAQICVSKDINHSFLYNNREIEITLKPCTWATVTLGHNNIQLIKIILPNIISCLISVKNQLYPSNISGYNLESSLNPLSLWFEIWPVIPNLTFLQNTVDLTAYYHFGDHPNPTHSWFLLNYCKSFLTGLAASALYIPLKKTARVIHPAKT